MRGRQHVVVGGVVFFKPASGQRVPALHYGRLSNLGMVELTDEPSEVAAVAPFEALKAAGISTERCRAFRPGQAQSPTAPASSTSGRTRGCHPCWPGEDVEDDQFLLGRCFRRPAVAAPRSGCGLLSPMITVLKFIIEQANHFDSLRRFLRLPTLMVSQCAVASPSWTKPAIISTPNPWASNVAPAQPRRPAAASITSAQRCYALR